MGHTLISLSNFSSNSAINCSNFNLWRCSCLAFVSSCSNAAWESPNFSSRCFLSRDNYNNRHTPNNINLLCIICMYIVHVHVYVLLYVCTVEQCYSLPLNYNHSQMQPNAAKCSGTHWLKFYINSIIILSWNPATSLIKLLYLVPSVTGILRFHCECAIQYTRD